MNEHDWNLLNAYLDDELPSRERSAFETRLGREPDLQSEMESIRTTVSLMKLAKRVPVPRNFTLDPAIYGQPARLTLWNRLSAASLPRTAMALGTLSAVLMCVGVVLFVSQSSLGGAGAPQAAMMAQEAAAPEAQSDFAAGAVEAPPEAAEPAVAAVEEEPQPAGEDTARSSAPTESEQGGMGGGASATGGDMGSMNDAAEGAPSVEVEPIQPTSTIEQSAITDLTQEQVTEVANAQPYAAKGTEGAASQEPVPLPSEPPAPLPTRSLAILLVGVGGVFLVMAVILAVVARRQRS